MTPFTSAIVLVFGVLMIAAAVVGYRRTRRSIADFEIFETFEADELTQFAMVLRSWMVPRVEKRLKKLGWELAESSPSGADCIRAVFGKSNDPAAQPLSAVLHRLNRSGFISGASVNIGRSHAQVDA